MSPSLFSMIYPLLFIFGILTWIFPLAASVEEHLDDLFDEFLIEANGQSPYCAFLTTAMNPLVEADIWQRLEPYFLPDQHPIKSKLDHLFQKKRVTQSRQMFEAAGFVKIKRREPTNLIIGRHPDLTGYLLKVYLDTQPPVCEWCNWLKRIEGAHSIRVCLKRHRFQHFAVPKKWIYPLPEEPSPPSHYHRKNFILVVEDMRILKGEDNRQAFKDKITPEILEELYIILTEEGLIDSVYLDNIPFTKSGKIAFIDTEHHHLQPVKYEKLTRYLSTDMQAYWHAIIGRNQN